MTVSVRRAVSTAGLAVTLGLLAAACGGRETPGASDSSASSRPQASNDGSTAGYPVSVENCGRTVTFDAAPQRVVSLWQAPTEMMLALGLGDRITAMAGSYAAYPADLAEQAAAIPEIGTSMSWPSREVVLSEAPDLVVGQSLQGFAFDTSAGYASVEQLEESGATVYGANMCEPGDNLDMTLDTSSRTLTDLGRIFGVGDRSDELVAALAEQKQAVVDAVQGEDDVDVAYYNGGEGPLTVLAGGIYDDLITTAGGTNVFPADSVYVSKEEFAASDPDVILVGTFEGQELDTLRTYLETTFPEMTAVREGRIEEVPVGDTDASVGVMRGLTEIANALHPDLDLAVPAS